MLTCTYMHAAMHACTCNAAIRSAAIRMQQLDQTSMPAVGRKYSKKIKYCLQ